MSLADLFEAARQGNRGSPKNTGTHGTAGHTLENTGENGVPLVSRCPVGPGQQGERCGSSSSTLASPVATSSAPLEGEGGEAVVCTPEVERAAIQAAYCAEALPTPEEVLTWPLAEVDRRRLRLRIRSRLLGCDLWLVPTGDPGPEGGLPVYTTDEARELLKLSPSDLADSIQRIHLAKLSFGPAATVEEVAP